MEREQRGADGGFTLIELLVTVTVMTIVLGALAMGVVTLLRTTAVTTNRLVGSHDAQLLTEWITADVQSAASAPSLDPATPPGCADDASLPAGGTNVAQMTWTDRSTGYTYHAAYRVEKINDGPPPTWFLVRYFCQEGPVHPTTRFPVVRGLKNGSVCPPGDLPGTNSACGVVTPASLASPAFRFDLQIVSVSGDQSYTFTATATGRTAEIGYIDATPPQLICILPPPDACVRSIVAYNTDSSGNAGLIKRIVLKFDEALNPLYTGDWTLQNPPNNAAITSVTVANNIVTLTLSASGSPIVTTTGSFTISLLDNLNGIRDGAGNRASFNDEPVLDGMAPVITDAITDHANASGQIDHVTLTMSEPLVSAAIPPIAPGYFKVALPTDPLWTPAIVVDDTFPSSTTIGLTLANAPVDTAATGLTVAMGFGRDAAQDTDYNFGASGRPVRDGTPPILLSATSLDLGGGDIDRVRAHFSEPIQPATDTAQWRLDIPPGPVWTGRPIVDSLNVVGNDVTLNLDAKMTSGFDLPYDTLAAGLQAKILSPSPTGIRDASGNEAQPISKPVIDGMHPVLRNGEVTFNHGTTPGRFENGDSLTANFTEPLMAASTTTVPVTLDQPIGAPSARINIPGLTNGFVSIRSGLYFSAPGTANWTATVERSGDNKIVVTLISDCYGAGCANLLDGPPVTMPMDLDNTIMDPSGLVALDPPVLAFQWF